MAKNIHGTTAGGPDGWRAFEIKALPRGLWCMAAEICGRAEHNGYWPNNLRGATIVMIPKEGAKGPVDMRPIALLPLFYRIWAAARRKHVRNWEIGAGHSETDVLGRSAEEAAWEMAADAEYAASEGRAIAAVLLDCAKCYERVPLEGLKREAIAKGFPKELAKLAVDIYEGPRWVRVGQAYGEAIRATHGIMPGCGLAVALLKAFFMTAVEVDTGQKVCKYVDDMKVWITGESQEVARDILQAYRKIKGRL